jgi:hypothetical protein
MPALSRVARPANAGATPTRLLQRCSCGGKSGGTCEACRKKKQMQRKAAGGSTLDLTESFDVSPSLTHGGTPVPDDLRASLGPLFGTDFADVRLHDDATSHATARDVEARAFTLGQHIHFGAGEFRPKEREGRQILAHELTHTLQQRGSVDDAHAPVSIDAPDSHRERDADRAAERVTHGERVGVESGGAGRATAAGGPMQRLVQRVGFWQTLARLFFEGTFSDKELLDYLQYLDDHSFIEGDFDSDNKARAIIKRWRSGDKKFRPTLKQKKFMLLEMIDGPTFDADEQAILEMLRGSTDSEVVELIGVAGGEEALKSEFHWSESDELNAFLDAFHAKKSHSPVGSEELEKGKVAIKDIFVDQSSPQVVKLFYADGRIESNTCSAGKGTCCAEPGDSGGPSDSDTTINDSNWTPNGTHTVFKKDEDHSGINWWTQFHTRAIALHEYTPVDGTPLSHGCVRLNGDFARRVFQGSRKGMTKVHVSGTPRPRCDHGALKDEWEKDFSHGTITPSDGEGRELKKHLSLAFHHPGDKALEKKISEGRIPRCPGGRKGGTP